MKSITKISIRKLLIALILSLGIVLSITSITSAKTSNFTIHKGWNLVGGELLLRDIGLDSGLLDKYPAYYYNPMDKEYHQFDGTYVSGYEQYTNNYVLSDTLQSFWIYNDGDNLTFSVNFDNSQLKKTEIGLQKLKQGWNIISITNSMYYDDNGQANNLSPNKIKGTCDIEKAYIFDASQQQWMSWGTETSSFDDDTIGMGWAVKVKNDCQLSVKANIPAIPSIPN